MKEALKHFIENDTIKNLKIYVLGRSEKLAGSIRRAGNRNPYSLQLLNENVEFDDLEEVGKNTLYFYDSSEFKNLGNLIEKLVENNSHIFDLAIFEEEKGEKAILEYKETHPAADFGLRRIQCLHITGMAGARYGLKLLKTNKPNLDLKNAKVVVLGYGNVARGAMHEIYNQGVEKIHILGRTHTTEEKIKEYLKDVDLVINGAELPFALRGKIYLLTNEHLQTVVPNKSVVIDLVGGSSTNRSAIEGVIDCTFLTKPHFDLHGVTLSALWGWPMLGMMKESAIKYSSQIIDVLIKKEKIIEGLSTLEKGVKRALVCGPFKK